MAAKMGPAIWRLGSLGLLLSIVLGSGLLAIPAEGAQECFGKTATINDNSGQITGTNGNDVIIGDNGANDIDGKGGTDRICSRDGNDVIEANGKLFADGGEGDDEINGTDSADDLRGGVGEDTLYGNGAKDVLKGGDDDDTLYGGVGNDTLKGSDGNDDLFGEEGTDKLFGGDGNDTINGGPDPDFCSDDGQPLHACDLAPAP